MTVFQASQVAVEVPRSGAANLQNSQLALEVPRTGAGNLRNSQLALEVIRRSGDGIDPEVDAALTAAMTMGAATVSAAGVLPVAASVSATLGAATVSVTVLSTHEADLAAVLAGATIIAAAALPIAVSLAAQLGPALLLAAGGIAGINGDLSRALGAALLGAAGGAVIKATVAGTLGPASTAGSANARAGIAAALVLGAPTLASAGTVLLSVDCALTLAPATSHGTRSDAGAVQRVLRRRFTDRVLRKNTMKLGKLTKQPAEREAYAIEYEDDLASGDKIATGPVVLVEIQGGTADTIALIISPIDVSATRVTLWVAGGTNGATYKITVTANTLSGRVLQDEFTLKIKDI